MRSDEGALVGSAVAAFGHADNHMMNGAGFSTTIAGRMDRSIFVSSELGCIIAGTVTNVDELAALLESESTDAAELVALAVRRYGSYGAVQRVKGAFSFVSYDQTIARVMVARSGESAHALFVGRGINGVFIASDSPAQGLEELKSGHLMYGASLLHATPRRFDRSANEWAAATSAAKLAATAALSPGRAMQHRAVSRLAGMRRIDSEPALVRMANLPAISVSAPTSPMNSCASSEAGSLPSSPRAGASPTKYVPPGLRKRMDAEAAKAKALSSIRVISPVNVKDAKTHEDKYKEVVGALLAQKWGKIYAERPELIPQSAIVA